MIRSDDESGLHGRIARLARELHGPARAGDTDPDQVLLEITAAAVELIPGVDHAAITLIRRHPKGENPRAEVESVATTGPAAKLIDELQHVLGQGPCLDAVWEQESVRVADVRTETRWQDLMAAIGRESTVRSMLSLQLFTGDQELGALNLYSESPDAFDDDTEDLAVNLATHAAIAVSGARRGVQFTNALASRDLIGQAKGMIMERYDIDATAAFVLLTKLSQDSNVRLADVAAQLIATDHPDPAGE